MSRPSYRVQLLSSALDGVFFACLIKMAFLAAKDLDAPREAVMAFQAITAIPMMLSPVFAELLARSNRKRLFWITAVIGRLTFVGVAAWGHWAPFLFTGVLPWLVMPMILPAYNVYWQANYPAHLRGRILARVDLLRGAVAAACFWGFGHLLELDPELRRVIFPIGGVCGCISLAAIGHIRLRRRAVTPSKPLGGRWTGWRRLFRPWRGAIQVLVNHPTFFFYEMGFMLYGLGFMFCIFLRDDHFARDLNLPHDTFGTFLTISQLAMPAAAPLFGAIFDRLRAAWTTAVGCAFLVPYALSLAFAESVGGVYLAGLLFGVGMSGIHMCWQLGSVEFAGKEDAGPFTAVHAAFVGVRATMALPIAYAIQLHFDGSARPVFFAASGLFFCAVIAQLWVGRRQRREGALSPPSIPAADSGRLVASGAAGN